MYFTIEPKYQALPPEFGGLRVAENAEECAELFHAVNDRPKATVADVAYGGIISLVARRSAWTMTTQYQYLNPAPKLRDLDAERFRATEPDLAMSDKGENLGTRLGIPLMTRCEFPRLVWRPTALACDMSPGAKYPVISEIETHYRPLLETKNHLIWQKLDPRAEPTR
jgi:hypothetical protein